MKREALLGALHRHQPADAIEAEHRQRTIEFVSLNKNCCDRNLDSGHITASSWIIDETSEHTLLTHHRKLDRWLQLGGHIEEEDDILAAAQREAREESGLSNIHTLSDAIFDIDVHLIPARKREPQHYHYDVRFLFQARRGDSLIISDESHDLRWFSVEELQELPRDDSIDRMVEKMTALR